MINIRTTDTPTITQAGFVHYLGMGSTLLCLHVERIATSTVRIPPVRVTFDTHCQLEWLSEEIEELGKVCFGVGVGVMGVVRLWGWGGEG